MLQQLRLFPDVSGAGAEQHSSAVRPERLPTNTTTSGHSIHRWFNFIAGFSPEFVQLVTKDLVLGKNGNLLLDPFAGCATAPLTAARLGMRAIGYEAHPVFERICRAKLPSRHSLKLLAEIGKTMIAGSQNEASLNMLDEAPLAFLSKLFDETALRQLLGMREALRASGLVDEPLAFLILSKTLDLSSHSATDGIYKAPTTSKRSLRPIEAAGQTCQVVRSDLNRLEGADLSNSATIYGKSSENMQEIADGEVSIVVTSPPYLNNFDYAEMTRMYLYFWGIASSWGEITDKVRSRLIVNTTTALKGHKQIQHAYRQEVAPELWSELDEIVKALAERKSQKMGKKEYNFLVYPYFAQMTRVLKECYRVMCLGAPLHIMVADAALYGVHVAAPQVLASILRLIGFRDVSCSLVRRRGHRWVLDKREGSRIGLGEYHVQATR